MFTIEIGDKEYKVRYGINSFADTNLMDRTQWIIEQMNGDEEVEDQGKMLREMVICLRDLLYVGFKKYNPVEDLADIGDLMDDYIEEHKDDSDVIMNLFGRIAEELMAEGFLGDLFKTANKTEKQVRRGRKPKE